MTLSRTAALATLSLTASLLAFGPATAQQADDYEPSAAEQKLNCKQLSGRMQVRILQIRDYAERKGSSTLSRGLQSAFSKTVGTSPKGLDPDATQSQDLKMLQAYNRLLVAKGCRSYNLEQELQKRGPNDMPAATVPAVKTKKVKP